MIDFQHYYYLLLKRLWVIGLVVALGMIAAFAWVMRQPNIYQSRAVLQVESSERKILKEDSVTEDVPQSLDFVKTVVQSLTSRNILLRVVKANKLDKDPTFAPPKSANYNDDQLADMLARKVSVKERKGTRLIDITADDRDPVKARNLAASMVKEFLREEFDQRMSVSMVANDFLKEEAEKLKKKLEASEQELQRYRESNNAVSLEQNQNIIVEKLQEVSRNVTEAKNERLKIESDLDQLKQVAPGDATALLRISSVASIPEIAQINAELIKAQADLAEIKEVFKSKHPKYITAVNRIEGLRISLGEAASKAGDTLAKQYEIARQNESKLEEALHEQEAKALELNKLSIPYNVLSREVETDRAMYQSVVSRLKETGISAGAESAPYRLVEAALVPSKPSKPHRGLLLVVAFVLLTIAASTGVILQDSMNTGIRSVDEAETLLGTPVLAALPEQKLTPREKLAVRLARERVVLPERLETARKLLMRRKQGKQVGRRHLRKLFRKAPPLQTEEDDLPYPIALLDNPSSPLAEACRSIRASITLLGKQEPTRVLLFTSALPGEGKTFSSINTAVSFAQQGERTLLVDADLRRPFIHQALFEGRELPGLGDYLAGEKSLDEIIRTVERSPGLSAITAGSRVLNPAELLAGASYQELISTLLGKFDRIIIDSAPVNAVSDSLYLAGPVGHVVLVIRSEKTPRKAIQRAAALLRRETGKPLAGIVLNRLIRGGSAGYYYYYYGDKYLKGSVYGTGGQPSPSGSSSRNPPSA
jgi:capsular exopolysaccharide synthesis family protein